MRMETELCVVTLNCWGIRFISKDREARMAAIGDELATGKYDFVFLQEVWTTEDYERIKRRTTDVLPYSYYFYSGVIGAGICIFSKAEIKSAFFHQWAVNGYIHKVQHGDWFGGKGIGMVEVNYRGLTIDLYTAHLHAEYDRINDEYLAHRVIQAFDTAQFIKMTSKHADLVIVGGDLNTEPGDLAYKVIIQTADLKDSINCVDKPCPMEKLNTNETPNNSYTSQESLKQYPHGKRIDYVCFKANRKQGVHVKALSSEVPWPSRVPNENFSYSDHEAVVAKLKVTKANAADSPAHLSPDKKEVIEECIEICTTAMEHLQSSKKMYWIFSLACFCFLLAIGSFDLPGNFWWIVFLALRIFTFLLMVFAIIMSTVWNRMEVNGVLAGLLAMKLEIGQSPEYILSEVEEFERESFLMQDECQEAP